MYDLPISDQLCKVRMAVPGQQLDRVVRHLRLRVVVEEGGGGSRVASLVLIVNR